ncbi:hypothetical protein M422DRAFT_783657 [Sphaerobolus stellatus SS14]|uniref:Unplaced genomic scaffold SPHSTscaffold_159, whole genome shotgun sequence n=1 Tax=Sphaerobolus stellatus (strain SS14) TaxID=990650 RepID=A0A0C9UBH4_SPHS4|nr:hypothetical protein M422DRAFT_36063 [Sphaerobolus stellatus SS14]KIJ31964.1 hypothetical protein M422DRAFT_783657 [Sphaerobolus stellatus SS14]
MQLTSLFTLAFLALGVVANPLEVRSGPSVEAAGVSGLVAPPTHGEFSAKGAVPAAPVVTTGTTAHPGPTLHPDLPSPLPSVPALIICSAQTCLGTCLEFALSSLPLDTCLTSNNFAFASALAFSPTGAGFAFGVFAALDGCATAAQLPTVNTCFNLLLNGLPQAYDEFFLA